MSTTSTDSSLLQKVKKVLLASQVFPKQSRIIVGVSGGADSCALVCSLAELAPEYDWQLLVAHLNHGLRQQAQEESRYVAALAQQLSLPCYQRKLSLAQQGESAIEERARQARYQFFHELAQEHNAAFVALAHHQDDQVETILMKLLKGGGVAAMRGIPFTRAISPGCSVRVVRPLLSISKREILQFLRDRKIFWYEDISNRCNIYERNRIRNQVRPWLEEFFPHLGGHMLRLAQRASEMERYAQAEIERYWPKLRSQICPGNELVNRYLEKRETFLAFCQEQLVTLDDFLYPFFWRKLCNEFALDLPLREHHYQAFKQVISQGQGRVHLPKSLVFEVRGKRAFCFALPSLQDMPVWLREGKVCALGLKLTLSKEQHSSPWQLRMAQPGDTIVWNNKKHKLSKMFAKWEVPAVLRTRVPVVTDATGSVLWVLGWAGKSQQPPGLTVHLMPGE